MAGSNKRVQRSAPATSVGAKRIYVYENQNDPDQNPVIVLARIDNETACNATRLSGHKGSVLLEEVKPGQRVFLNASFVLGQPFVFETEVAQLQEYMRKQSKETCIHLLEYAYRHWHKHILSMLPKLHSWMYDNTKHSELFTFMKDCEITAVLKQLCFGEPVPLIDMATVRNNTHNMTEAPSSTKARKVDKPAPLDISQENANSNASENVMGGTTKDQALLGVEVFAFPCIVSGGKQETVFACFQDALDDPDRLIMPLKHMLKIHGVLVTSKPLLLKIIDNFEKRVGSENYALQKDYRDSFQACNQFINQEGGLRSNDDWLNFITNCVHVHALRHVLYGKPLLASVEGQTPDIDQLLKMLDGLAVASGRSHDDFLKIRCNAATGGADGVSRGDIKHVEEVTVLIEDCGQPLGIITTGSCLSGMLQFADDACAHDIAAAKKHYTQLTKRCMKTAEEVINLQDKATVGIEEAVKELRSWTNDCLYLCVLRGILHNVPLKVYCGDAGMLGDGRRPFSKGFLLCAPVIR